MPGDSRSISALTAGSLGSPAGESANSGSSLKPTSSSGTEVRSLDESLAAVERQEIISALDRANGQRTRAAELLRISRSRLYRRMEALGIRPQDDGGSPSS